MRATWRGGQAGTTRVSRPRRRSAASPRVPLRGPRRGDPPRGRPTGCAVAAEEAAHPLRPPDGGHGVEDAAAVARPLRAVHLRHLHEDFRAVKRGDRRLGDGAGDGAGGEGPEPREPNWRFVATLPSTRRHSAGTRRRQLSVGRHPHGRPRRARGGHTLRTCTQRAPAPSAARPEPVPPNVHGSVIPPLARSIKMWLYTRRAVAECRRSRPRRVEYTCGLQDPRKGQEVR
jgi:hypothetical protein